jgi:succinate-acetate transporter protein
VHSGDHRPVFREGFAGMLPSARHFRCVFRHGGEHRFHDMKPSLRPALGFLLAILAIFLLAVSANSIFIPRIVFDGMYLVSMCYVLLKIYASCDRVNLSCIAGWSSEETGQIRIK